MLNKLNDWNIAAHDGGLPPLSTLKLTITPSSQIMDSWRMKNSPIENFFFVCLETNDLVEPAPMSGIEISSECLSAISSNINANSWRHFARHNPTATENSTKPYTCSIVKYIINKDDSGLSIN